MKKRQLILGTRGSDLAMAQAKQVQTALEKRVGAEVKLEVIQTTGDTRDSVPLSKLPGKGFFTKEIEQALLDNRIDIAVHSLKDLPTTQPEGLSIAAVAFREDRRDVLIVKKGLLDGTGVLPLAKGLIIGTGSTRRQAQIAFHNPHLEIKDLRGNVPTRIEKLRSGEYDAVIVSAAGLARLMLDLSEFDIEVLDPGLFLPAPGQGALAMEVRSDDTLANHYIHQLDNEKVRTEARLERGLLAKFDAGCSLPLGVYSELVGKRFHLKAVLGERENDTWDGLKTSDTIGDDIDSVIDDAYRQLTGS